MRALPWPRLLLFTLPALAGGCELERVTVPLGVEQIVVQGVLTLDPGAEKQYIVVERSLTGTAIIPDQDSLPGPPRPPLPVTSALVVVTRDDGDSVRFTEGETPGVYELMRAEASAFLRPGGAYQLRVTTPDGRVVTGRTRIPEFPSVEGMPAEGSAFDRDHDTVRIRWSGAAGSKGVFVQLRPRDVAGHVTLLLVTDSTRITLPGNMPFPIPHDTIPPVVWIPGARQALTVAAVDTSFFEHLYTMNDPFTGSGHVNRLEGGIGFIGSIAPITRIVEVRGHLDHPYEGRYTLEALIGQLSLRATVELYVSRDRPDPVLVNALVSGASDSGAAVTEAFVGQASGRVEGGELRLELVDDRATDARDRWRLAGTFNSSGTTTGTVRDAAGRSVGSFTLTRRP